MATIKIPQFDIRKIAESGQCFRLNEMSKNKWMLIAFGKCLVINVLDHCEYEFECSESDFYMTWYNYFDLEGDYESWMNSIPKEDQFLRNALEFGKGMKILKQDPWEMLISFIISQRKNMPAIKYCVEALCAAFGEEIENRGLYSFPTAKAIATAEENEFHQCSLGYRLPYIRKAAQIVASGELDLSELASKTSFELTDSQLMSSLQIVPGVGPKVAQCVMLFGFHRLEAFPVDVWIERVIREHYDGNFPIELYPGIAGVIQQYLFYYARNHNK